MAMVKDDILDLSMQKVPFAKAFFALGMGIVLAKYLTLSPSLLLLCGIFCFFVMLMAVRKTHFPFVNLIFSTNFYFFFIVTGCWLMNKDKPIHIIDYFDKIQSNQFVGIIGDEPILKEKTIRFPLKIKAVLDSNKFLNGEGTIYVTVMKDSVSRTYEYGDELQILGSYSPINPAYNPAEFNYKQYLNNKGIYYQVFVEENNIHINAKNQGNWLISTSLKLRQSLIQKFERYIDNERSFQIAIALIFGYRSQVDSESLRAFTNTGTIHVLSVSGLHVGLVFGFLNIMLLWLNRFRYGKLVRSVIIIIAIWAYVVLTGMSPPILRAGIMITFFTLSILFSRKQIALNTLFASAFFILLFAPNYLLDVGFQLSYSAILGIILFYPLLANLYIPSNKWSKYIVEYIYVSLAAQLFTLPLALYYFHQFPNYFLIANLFIAIPSTLVMYSGILLAVIPFDFASKLFGKITTWLLDVLVDGLLIIEKLPYAIEEGIYWDVLAVVLLLAILFTFIYAFDRKNKYCIWISSVLSLLLIAHLSFERYKVNTYQGFRIYNLKSNMAIASINRGHVTLISNLDSINHSILNFSVLPDLKRYINKEKIQYVHVDLSERKNLELEIANKRILLLENIISDIPDGIDYILWRKNNRNELGEMLNNSNAKIVIDGSNSNKTIDFLAEENLLDNGRVYILKNNFAYVWHED